MNFKNLIDLTFFLSTVLITFAWNNGFSKNYISNKNIEIISSVEESGDFKARIYPSNDGTISDKIIEPKLIEVLHANNPIEAQGIEKHYPSLPGNYYDQYIDCGINENSIRGRTMTRDELDELCEEFYLKRKIKIISIVVGGIIIIVFLLLMFKKKQINPPAD